MVDFHVSAVLDLAGPAGDGSFVVAAAGRLSKLSAGGTLTPFARGPNGYSTPLGPEPYVASASGHPFGGSGCSVPSGSVFAIDPDAHHPGVVEVDPGGVARRFANFPVGGGPDGIAFDDVGRFGHRLLVTSRNHGTTTLFAVDCAGKVSTILAGAAAVEGGIVVAPATFGHFGGDLIAPSEVTGRIFAFSPTGAVVLLAVSGLPHGGDIGVESAGFVPAGFGSGGAAYLSDRLSPRNKHPGDDAILRLSGAALLGAGVMPGDLLVASEGGAETIAVHCGSTCTIKDVADGPSIAHGEGHIVFALTALGSR